MLKYIKKILGITRLENIIMGQLVVNKSLHAFVKEQGEVNKALKTFFDTVKFTKQETTIIDLNDPIDEDKFN